MKISRLKISDIFYLCKKGKTREIIMEAQEALLEHRDATKEHFFYVGKFAENETLRSRAMQNFLKHKDVTKDDILAFLSLYGQDKGLISKAEEALLGYKDLSIECLRNLARFGSTETIAMAALNRLLDHADLNIEDLRFVLKSDRFQAVRKKVQAILDSEYYVFLSSLV